MTLTGVTATDLSNSVQLGKQAVGTTAAETYTTAATATITAGALNDHITAGATAVTIDAGAGDDVIVATAGGTVTLTGGAGADTFSIDAKNAGDVITIKDLGGSDILKVAATVDLTTGAAITVTEDWTATAASTNAAKTEDTILNLKDGVDINMTLATFAAATNGYTIKTDAAVTQGATIVGSGAADIITGSTFADTITGGEGADTITGGAGNDTIILTENISAKDVVILGSVTAAGIDTIVGFNAGGTGAGTEVDTIKTSAAAALAGKGTLDKATYATLDAAIASFAAGGANATAATKSAYTFKYDSKDYLLIDNDGVAGYLAATDSVVEITGLVGTLDVTDILIA